ncbi:hypothetical protein OG21DRAFT_1396453, partial [Imleria badia]
GMEVDAIHWTKLAFLVSTNHDGCVDMHGKIEKDLGVDLDELVKELNQPPANETDQDSGLGGDSASAENDADMSTDNGAPVDGPDELDKTDSGFGLEGKPVHFSSGKF